MANSSVLGKIVKSIRPVPFQYKKEVVKIDKKGNKTT